MFEGEGQMTIVSGGSLRGAHLICELGRSTGCSPCCPQSISQEPLLLVPLTAHLPPVTLSLQPGLEPEVLVVYAAPTTTGPLPF